PGGLAPGPAGVRAAGRPAAAAARPCTSSAPTRRASPLPAPVRGRGSGRARWARPCGISCLRAGTASAPGCRGRTAGSTAPQLALVFLEALLVILALALLGDVFHH